MRARDRCRLKLIASWRPRFPPRFSTASGLSRVSTSGFSYQTCFPAARAHTARSTWVSCGVAMTTTSTPGLLMTASAPETRPLLEAVAFRYPAGGHPACGCHRHEVVEARGAQGGQHCPGGERASPGPPDSG